MNFYGVDLENKKINALMLRAVDYGENDKILTLLSAEEGRITAGIKGVKKSGAKLKFAAQPFCFAEYVLASSGGRYTVIQASECESFYDLRTDINRYYAACAVCEAAIALTYEGDGGENLFSDCVHALGEMCRGDEGIALITFLVKALKSSGYGVRLDDCAKCGADLTTALKLRFDMDTGSFTCYDCGDGIGASGVTFNVLRMAEGLPHDKESITADGKKRALRLLKEYVAYKVDAKLNSLSEYLRLI